MREDIEIIGAIESRKEKVCAEVKCLEPSCLGRVPFYQVYSFVLFFKVVKLLHVIMCTFRKRSGA